MPEGEGAWAAAFGGTVNRRGAALAAAVPVVVAVVLVLLVVVAAVLVAVVAGCGAGSSAEGACQGVSGDAGARLLVSLQAASRTHAARAMPRRLAEGMG